MKTNDPKLWVFIFGAIFSILSFFMFCDAEKNHSRTSVAERQFTEISDSATVPLPVRIDWPEIKEREKITAITSYSATSYFIYRGQPMGFEYELLSRLADDFGLKLEIIIEDDFDKIFDRLNNGECDLIAYGLTVTRDRKEKVAFTDHLFTTRQVLVQRKPSGWTQMTTGQIEQQLLRNPLHLLGKTIHIKNASAYESRLQNLSEEMGGNIDIVRVGGDTTTEELIQEVADGKIEYTVADRHLALINQAYYHNIDVKTAIGFPQRIAWAVRNDSPILLDTLNHWIDRMKRNKLVYLLHAKYFENRRAFSRRAQSDFLSLDSGRVSPYDNLIKKQSRYIAWDWRLLASLIYRESRFISNAESWSGAIGIMQLMPRTAKSFGAENLLDPFQNIKAGVRYIKWLQNYWDDKINDKSQRLKFILASYNVGIGHVEDARRLAEKNGKQADVWDDNVAYFMRKLSEPEFFKDDVVKYGYCRGLEPFNYVNDILAVYDHYKKLIIS